MINMLLMELFANVYQRYIVSLLHIIFRYAFWIAGTPVQLAVEIPSVALAHRLTLSPLSDQLCQIRHDQLRLSSINEIYSHQSFAGRRCRSIIAAAGPLRESSPDGHFDLSCTLSSEATTTY